MNKLTCRRLLFFIFATSLFSFLLCTKTPGGDVGIAKSENVLQKMLKTKEIIVGYGGYAPYLIREPNTQEISGYSVDILKAILDPLGIKVKWQETTWDNMKQDILLKKFDLMIEPIFMTIPRSAQVGFTIPYAYFGYASVLVRKGETRFKSIEDLNKPNLTLAVTQGVTDQEYVERNLPKAKVKLIPGNDISITLTEVLIGKADAALADVPTILQFLKAHPNDVIALFLNNPPATTPAAFMTRPDEVEFINFLNNALLYLEANGFFDSLERKYDLPSFREKKSWISGSALKK